MMRTRAIYNCVTLKQIAERGGRDAAIARPELALGMLIEFPRRRGFYWPENSKMTVAISAK